MLITIYKYYESIILLLYAKHVLQELIEILNSIRNTKIYTTFMGLDQVMYHFYNISI